MKRIESACVEKIQHFETEMQCGEYLRREYNGYSVGDYLKKEEEEA